MFPQYIALFSLGCAAGRRGWLETIGPPPQRRLRIAGAAAAALPARPVGGRLLPRGAAEDRFAGGPHWQAAAGALLEGVLATCLSLWAVRISAVARPAGTARSSAHGAARLRGVPRPPAGARGPGVRAAPLPAPAELKFLLALAAAWPARSAGRPRPRGSRLRPRCPVPRRCTSSPSRAAARRRSSWMSSIRRAPERRAGGLGDRAAVHVQRSWSSPARAQGITCAAKASLISTRSMSFARGRRA